jgi:hypothetical protein
MSRSATASLNRCFNSAAAATSYEKNVHSASRLTQPTSNKVRSDTRRSKSLHAKVVDKPALAQGSERRSNRRLEVSLCC